MDLFPAIDIRGGRCVRLHQGDYAAETIYDDDPVRVARAYEDAGAQFIHVVDLDAARTGELTNLETVEAVCLEVFVPVQVGGGVRSTQAAAALFAAGASRVVVGTAAVEDPDLVGALMRAHQRRIVIGLDARGRDVAVRGWKEGSGADLVDLARRFDDPRIAALVVTEIGRDGTMTGPDLDQLRLVVAATSVPVIASGGVGALDDLRALAQLEVDGRRLAGAIVGKALYEQRFTVAEGLIACSR